MLCFATVAAICITYSAAVNCKFCSDRYQDCTAKLGEDMREKIACIRNDMECRKNLCPTEQSSHGMKKVDKRFLHGKKIQLQTY